MVCQHHGNNTTTKYPGTSTVSVWQSMLLHSSWLGTYLKSPVDDWPVSKITCRLLDAMSEITCLENIKPTRMKQVRLLIGHNHWTQSLDTIIGHNAPCTMHHAPCPMPHAPCTVNRAPCTGHCAWSSVMVGLQVRM